MHTITVSENRDHKFEEEQTYVQGKVWGEEREWRNEIKTQSQKQTKIKGYV